MTTRRFRVRALLRRRPEADAHLAADIVVIDGGILQVRAERGGDDGKGSDDAGQVGLRIVLFEACSAFTRVTAYTLALSPYFVTRFPKASATSLPP
jgi:hypothetical protein